MEPIVFDKASGISLEEQQEILASLNTLERPLERGEAVASYEKQAKKKGVLLPALTNGIAAAVLALGLAVLFLTHERDEVRFMQGAATPSVTERKLIAEIRREFADQLSAKDAEIADILAKIAGVDVEMQNVQLQFDNKIIIESEKEKALADLQRQKDEYQSRLAALQRERGELLEDARIREAALRSQLSANRELSGQVQSVQAELASAQELLRSFTSEQEKNALIELQIDGYFATVNEQISAALFDQAASTLSALRDFLDTPSFQNIKAFRERKPARLALINTLSELTRNSMRLRADASFSETPADQPLDSGQSEQIEKYEEAIAELTARNNELEQIASERERSGRDSANANSAILNELRTRNQALQETVTSRENTLAELRNQNTALQQSLAAQENAAAALRTQVSSLQQSGAEKDASISALQAQNSELQQRAEQLQTQNDAIRQLLNN